MCAEEREQLGGRTVACERHIRHADRRVAGFVGWADQSHGHGRWIARVNDRTVDRRAWPLDLVTLAGAGGAGGDDPWDVRRLG